MRLSAVGTVPYRDAVFPCSQPGAAPDTRKRFRTAVCYLQRSPDALVKCLPVRQRTDFSMNWCQPWSVGAA